MPLKQLKDSQRQPKTAKTRLGVSWVIDNEESEMPAFKWVPAFIIYCASVNIVLTFPRHAKT